MALDAELTKYRRPIDTKNYNLFDFFGTFGKRLNGDDVNATPIYHNIMVAEDAISEDLSKVCMAYDDVSDRGLVWVTEKHRVESYRKTLFKHTHVGIIGLIDLQLNIESFQRLIKDPNYLIYKEELEDEIKYWSKYYKDGEGHRFFVFIGKNRSLYALPIIYQNTLKDYPDTGINILKQKYFIKVELYTEYVTKEYKTELYRNEKDNFKDTPIMEWIGYNSPITDLVNDETKTILAKSIMPKMFKIDKRIKYEDRQLVLDCYSLLHNKYGDNEWAKSQFKEGYKIHPKFKTIFKYFLNVYKTLYSYDTSRIKIFKNQSVRMLVFKCCEEIVNGAYKLKDNNTQYEDVYESIFKAHQNLDGNETTHYGFRKDGGILTFSELKSGMSGNSGYFDKDSKMFTFQHKFNKDKRTIEYVHEKQGDVLIKSFVSEFLKVLNETDKLVLPAKRGFTEQDFSYISKRDNSFVRINGEVYDKDGNVKRFSDEKPDDVFIKEYGTDVDYISLDFKKLWGPDVQVDHIMPFSKNKGIKDLDRCELTSSGFNNWKDNREAAYESKVIEKIIMNKELMNIE
jgi:hypothetical protein